MDEVMDESDCAECELCGMRLCGIRIVQNATRLVRLCGMQRDGEIQIVLNAECDEIGEIVRNNDCVECGMQRDGRDPAEYGRAWSLVRLCEIQIVLNATRLAR
jgi:hypothetical protein